MSKWSHLPNAVHIDQILVHVKTNPEKWEAVNGTMYTSAWNAAWNAAGHATAWNEAVSAAWAWNAWNARNAVWSRGARGAILALIAYPDCTYLLNMTPEQLEIYAHLGARGAWLLLPAVIAMNENENE